jgi:hypothetical protein
VGDARVVLKKDYLDRKCKDLSLPIEQRLLQGKDWYNQQATRAVNQAIGRVIRHVQDFGQIVLCDERFAWRTNAQGISKWLRSQVVTYKIYDQFDLKMRAFFQQMAHRNFTPKVKQLEQLCVEINEGDEAQMRINSKMKIDNNQDKSRKGVKLGFTNDSQEKEEAKLGFIPAMFANKKKKPEDEDTSGPNTITKMFKNAPPPRAKPKRVIDDISGAEEEKPENKSSKMIKTEIA